MPIVDVDYNILMSIAKYNSPEERWAVVSEKSRAQMLKQWQEHRETTGNPLGYFGGHRRVRTRRGPAKLHKCIWCGINAQHWAQIHDTNGDDPSHYQAMCQKCHWKYDGVGKKVKANMTPEQCSNAAKKAWVTKRKKKEQQCTS